MKLSIKQGAFIALTLSIAIAVFASLSDSPISAQSPARAKSGSDWADWRGPTRDGHSYEKNLPEKWSKQGDNLLWKAPYGGRSAPIVMNGRVFMFNSAGEGETMQERVLALDAETGRKIWEHRFNVYSSDVPPRRIAWSSPVGDPTTGNVYAFGACNELVALSFDGKLVWQRSLTDEYGAWTTHGGRTVSPIIEGDLVIVSTVTDGFGDISSRRNRYYAFDKRTGENVWISTPGGRPFDTTYSTPIVATTDGMRLMIAGGGDGSVSAMKVATGEPVWTYPMSKRGVNPGVVVKDGIAYVTHQEENLDVSEMGHLAAIDISAKGAISKTSNKDKIKYAITNFQLGPSSPVIEGNTLYAVTAESSIHAFNIADGKPLWEKKLGTIQKASPVYADGKIYVGTENGKFYILKPGPTDCQILDEDELEPVDKIDLKTVEGDELIAANEQIIGGVAVSRGRIYLVSTKNIYAIGKKKNPALPPAPEKPDNAPAGAAVAHVQIFPAELVMKPGETKTFKVRLFDDRGRFIREEANAQWSLDGLKGEAAANKFTAAADGGLRGGQLKATVGGATGVSKIRVIPALPYSEDFSNVPVDKAPSYWLNTDGVPIKYFVREIEGNKVLVKRPDAGIFKRTRSPFGVVDTSNYTVQADVRAIEKRRQMGDAGIVNQRYELVMFGNIQKIELRSWQIEPKRTFTKPFAWKADTWYRLKLQVENLPDGKTRARGKAWPASDPEPAEWLIEWTDPIGNRIGSAGIFADSANELFFDNIKVTPNK
ncbi:MAG: PQQ-binding-like beta-propeller repeat protein [Acidobacteria bacterium]|nr:PQQ-binding-like beta-propeller repeat protein [Acidobacteriota bacterium]